jgi:hypothetical protein
MTGSKDKGILVPKNQVMEVYARNGHETPYVLNLALLSICNKKFLEEILTPTFFQILQSI